MFYFLIVLQIGKHIISCETWKNFSGTNLQIKGNNLLVAIAKDCCDFFRELIKSKKLILRIKKDVIKPMNILGIYPETVRQKGFWLWQ